MRIISRFPTYLFLIFIFMVLIYTNLFSQPNFANYTTISDLTEDYQIWIKFEIVNYPYYLLEDDLVNNGWTLQKYLLPTDTSQSAYLEELRLYIPPNSNYDSSFVLIHHETGPEIFGLSTALFAGAKEFYNWINEWQTSLVNHLGTKPTQKINIVLKGKNWEFKSKGLTKSEVSTIREFLSNFK